MVEDANKKFYFDIISQKERASFLNKAAKESYTAQVWKKGDDKEKAELFKVTNFDSTHSELHLELEAKGLLGKFKSSTNIDKEILIKIAFDNIYLFTNTSLRYDVARDIYKVALPKDIYKSQQRSNYRLDANKFIRIQFKIDSQVFEALDVSAGGTSFNCAPQDQIRFAKGNTFKDCKVKISDYTYDIPEVKVASLQSAPFRDKFGNETEVFKVGIAFSNMPKKTEEDLTITINAEARGEELRKMHAAKN